MEDKSYPWMLNTYVCALEQADASLRMRLVGKSITTHNTNAKLFSADRISPPDYLMPGTGTTGQVVPVRGRAA